MDHTRTTHGSHIKIRHGSQWILCRCGHRWSLHCQIKKMLPFELPFTQYSNCHSQIGGLQSFLMVTLKTQCQLVQVIVLTFKLSFTNWGSPIPFDGASISVDELIIFTIPIDQESSGKRTELWKHHHSNWVNLITTSLRQSPGNKGNHPPLWPNYSSYRTRIIFTQNSKFGKSTSSMAAKKLQLCDF